MTPDSAVVLQRCDVLSGFSEENGRLTRRFASEPMRGVHDTVAAWMRVAGMTVRRDNIGNLIGRYEALPTSPATPLSSPPAVAPAGTEPFVHRGNASGRDDGARTLLLGSHLDTVRDAGRYDGPLGVLVALACVERLHAVGTRLPFAIEVVAFADEEGLRYHSAYLGSAALAGTLDPADLELIDEDGITLAEAIRRFGGDPAMLHADRRASEDLLGYCEVHIEQGPVLEERGLPVGVVAAIAGQSRLDVIFSGLAGHAGTVPMPLRRDALCAAAEFVLAVEAEARGRAGLVATVGQIGIAPGASNVIPGAATLSLDLRHQDDAERLAALEALRERAEGIAAARGAALDWRPLQQAGATRCDERLSDLLARAVEQQGYPVLRLPSGAGHDAVALAALTPVAMLFVRCAGGVSHHPAEAVAQDDVAVAIEVLSRFLSLLTTAG